MWLINVTTLQLEEFWGGNIPPYAILSHTWESPKEELSYEDINTRPVPQKSGIQKIKYLCNQAAKDGLSWAWCDTCCVNKNSTTELSEAINSMYLWYKKAAVCYAYLSDVPAIGSAKERAKNFSKSRWFTRGWTLQELLAPLNVKFYIQNWGFYGTKKDLFALLKKITGIDDAALSWPWTIESYCIANKMSWASQRVTTRPEDRAYCMLGILGVHIELLYGEGQNAFQRLQQELIRSCDDESVFAHSGPNILAESPEAFNLGHNVTSFPSVVVGHHSNVPSNEPADDLCYPFTVTNMGINIRLRLVPQICSKESSTSKVYGVLNCRDALEYKYIFAIPLRPTSMSGVYTRAPGDLRRITESQTQPASLRTIFIRQCEPPVTHITCILRHYLVAEHYDLQVFGARGLTWTATAECRKVILYLNPKGRHDLQELHYAFQARSHTHSFTVKLVFDLVSNRARVSIFHGSGKDLHCDRAIEMQRLLWPDSAELDIYNTIGVSDNQNSIPGPRTVRARIYRERGLSDWSLIVSNET